MKLNNNLTKYKFQKEINHLKNIINQSELLSKKYDVVVTNPPYMGNNGMNSTLKEYIKSNYPLTKTDLFAVFLEKGLDMIKDYGFNCMVTMQSWMFLSSFEKFRKKLIETTTISNLLHMDNMVMKIAFGTSATVFRKTNLIDYNSTFYHVKLSDVENDIVDPLFFNDENRYLFKQVKFNKIPGKSIVYWISDEFIETFDIGISIDDLSDFTGSQNITANNNKYLRYFWEIDFNEIGNKWVKYAKGGPFKKFYGNIDLVIDWTEDARDFYSKNKTSNLLAAEYCFREGITYTDISSRGTGFRYLPPHCVFDKAGPSLVNVDNLYYCLGFLNTNIAKFYLDIFNPTLHIQVKDVKSIPIIIHDKYVNEIEKIAYQSVDITKRDWDDSETSFDFKFHPLLNDSPIIENNYNAWVKKFNDEFNLLKNNQIKLNSLFAKIYGLTNLIDIDVDDNDVTLSKRSFDEDICSFISYAIGCMFGRYSLDNEGLQFAGGNFDINNYHKFIPDDDNIIPVLDTAYFEDDIVGRFVEFIKTCFGEETLEENLDFIANALAKNKKPSRDKIRDYLLKNFFNDHKKTYKKCPIYWQFSSGKENGFNCLVYMHRYEPSLVARIRTDYLHKTQKAIEQAISNCDNIINHSSSSSEIARATKDKSKLQKQLLETQEYDDALAHIANQNIEIDLDDGVKVNYAKFQNIDVSREGKKTKKINLLKKL